MVAQTKKTTKKPTKVKPKSPRKSKVDTIIELNQRTNLLPIEIAEAVECDKSLVTHTLKKYGIEKNTLESFKINRADILSGIIQKDLETYSNLQPDERKKLIMKRGMIDMGILTDKERLERGQATSFTMQIHADIQELKGLQKQSTNSYDDLDD